MDDDQYQTERQLLLRIATALETIAEILVEDRQRKIAAEKARADDIQRDIDNMNGVRLIE